MPKPGKTVVPFGKFKGRTIDQVASTDDGLKYLDWMVGLDDLREPFKTDLTTYLAKPSVSQELDRILGDR
jgi:hypothetical protein